MKNINNSAFVVLAIAAVIVFLAALEVSAKTEQKQAQNQEQANVLTHRSAIADFIQGLSRVADKEGKIGEQLRVIVQQQKQAASTTVQAIQKTQERGKIKAFLLGSDYKNLGKLRSEIVQNRNRIEKLNRLTEDAQSEADKTELQNQVQALEREQTKIESFIKAQEARFSLFGWLVKFFNK